MSYISEPLVELMGLLGYYQIGQPLVGEWSVSTNPPFSSISRGCLRDSSGEHLPCLSLFRVEVVHTGSATAWAICSFRKPEWLNSWMCIPLIKLLIIHIYIYICHIIPYIYIIGDLAYIYISGAYNPFTKWDTPQVFRRQTHLNPFPLIFTLRNHGGWEDKNAYLGP